MAYTLSKLQQTVFGNERIYVASCSADAASGVVSMGFKVIDWAIISPISMATAAIKVKINKLANGTTASNGDIGMSSAASGDDFFLYVAGH